LSDGNGVCVSIAPTLISASSKVSSVVYTPVGSLFKAVDTVVTKSQELTGVLYKAATTSGLYVQEPVSKNSEVAADTYVSNGTGKYVAVSPSIASSKEVTEV